ncbi:uncharacterized protein LOC130626202 isoform X2 [Hydractinia symbiolongicarpus]|uniref:uncharacterized protein LOC130626202 isoform X2 n=1 Tax=Hydractinia symbiolongicarpus TaxID=13093 RepID=UPI002550EE3A|nr:uncharacterized protein LOC130626202 isoform X2 [Hydractinia symbiolongicarpus]
MHLHFLGKEKMWKLVLCVAFINSLKTDDLFVQRKAIGSLAPNTAPFIKSVDTFTNEYQADWYCHQRNAVCVNTCRECKCNNFTTFFSFNEGCKTYEEVHTLLNGSKCFDYLAKTWNFTRYIPSMGNSTSECGSFHAFKGTDEVETCNIRQGDSYAVDLCQQGKNCGINYLAGSLIYLALDCRLLKNREYSSRCFIFKLSGKNVIEGAGRKTTFQPTSAATAATTRHTTVFVPQQEKENNKKIIIGVVVVVVIVVIIVLLIVIVYLIRRRRKQPRTTQAKQLKEADEHIYAETGNPTYEETNIKPADVPSSKQNVYAYASLDHGKPASTNKEATSIYYKPSTDVVTGMPNRESENNLYTTDQQPPEHIYDQYDVAQVKQDQAKKSEYATVYCENDQKNEIETPLLDKDAGKADTNKRLGYDEVGSIINSDEK